MNDSNDLMCIRRCKIYPADFNALLIIVDTKKQ